MMEAARTSETSVDNHFTRQYIPEDNSELLKVFARAAPVTCVSHMWLAIRVVDMMVFIW
jgi:hypothetical protein